MIELIKELDWKDADKEKPNQGSDVLVAMDDLSLHEAKFTKRYTKVGFDECLIYEGCYRINKNLREKSCKITHWAYLKKKEKKESNNA